MREVHFLRAAPGLTNGRRPPSPIELPKLLYPYGMAAGQL